MKKNLPCDSDPTTLAAEMLSPGGNTSDQIECFLVGGPVSYTPACPLCRSADQVYILYLPRTSSMSASPVLLCLRRRAFQVGLGIHRSGRPQVHRAADERVWWPSRRREMASGGAPLPGSVPFRKAIGHNGLFGLWVIGTAVWHAMHGTLPSAFTMGAVGVAALIANAISFGILWAHRHGDSNMRSAWNCTRNDVLGNLAVLLAALGVFGTGTGWPDVIVAAIMAALALQGAATVVRQAAAELRQPVTVPAE
jgi:hypothetical protein